MESKLRKFIIVVSALLIISIALNIRFFFVFTKSLDDLVIYMADAMYQETEILKLIESDKIQSAKEELGKQIAFKAIYITECIEHECISRDAIIKIQNKSKP